MENHLRQPIDGGGLQDRSDEQVRRRALLVDDDSHLCSLLVEGLREFGWDVTSCGSGIEAIGLAEEGAFDAIALDHYMPGMDGLATLGVLRERGCRTPVVFVTGTEEGRVAVSALKAGASDYVFKSVGGSLMELLAAGLENARRTAELVTGKAMVEEELREANDRLEALLGEVNHRMANSLQIVSSIISMQAAAAPDEATRELLDDTRRRIQAIGQLHRRLYATTEVRSVDLAEYLAGLVEELAGTLVGAALPCRLSFVGGPARLATDRALSLGVVVTELVTNACKYAYGPSGGEIRVRLTPLAHGRISVEVEDDGQGIDDDSMPLGTGLGATLIAAMVRSLHATVVRKTGRFQGTRITLTFDG